MIIDIDGTIIWSHMSADASDIASAAHILAALQSSRLSAPARLGPAVDGA